LVGKKINTAGYVHVAHRISVSRQAEADTHGVMHMEMAKVDPNTVLKKRSPFLPLTPWKL